jgi:protoporphyrinogen oxidase
LLKVLPVKTIAKAACDLLGSRVSTVRRGSDFESFAVYNYGREISERFLLRYSEKLWGMPCGKLSTAISGARLKGLDLAAFLSGAVRDNRRISGHLDGTFLYPRRGIGMLAERLGAECGEANLRLRNRVTRIVHDGVRVQAVEMNRDELVPVDHVVSTLPLPVWLRLMDPAPKPELIELADSLRFRHVILVGVFIKRSRVTDMGTVYFVDPQFPMTRVYEPKNRSAAMAPPDRTMLVAEIPCGEGDAIWRLSDDAVVDLARPHFENLGWIAPGEILGACVKRMGYAYPVLEHGIEAKLGALADGLKGFTNLQFAGRNGVFQYAHLHDMMRFGQRAVARMAGAWRSPENAAETVCG